MKLNTMINKRIKIDLSDKKSCHFKLIVETHT